MPGLVSTVRVGRVVAFAVVRAAAVVVKSVGTTRAP